MHILPLAPSHIPDLTRLINAQIATIPPHWTLTESQVAAILQKDSLWGIHYEDDEPTQWTWIVETVCVIENERVLAAARFDHRYDDGRLVWVSGRWLLGQADQPTALGLLLDYLTAKRGQSEVKIHVNGRSDFGAGWSGIPTTSTHVMQILADKGFVPFQKWIIMTADITHFAADATPLPVLDPLRLEWAINVFHLEWNLNLYDGETLAGECQSWGIPPEFAASTDYDHWMQLEWLGVEKAYRRRGLARRLMHEQFRYHTHRGKHHCLFYTEVNNLPAISLYTALGFTTNAEVWGWMCPPT